MSESINSYLSLRLKSALQKFRRYEPDFFQFTNAGIFSTSLSAIWKALLFGTIGHYILFTWIFFLPIPGLILDWDVFLNRKDKNIFTFPFASTLAALLICPAAIVGMVVAAKFTPIAFIVTITTLAIHSIVMTARKAYHFSQGKEKSEKEVDKQISDSLINSVTAVFVVSTIKVLLVSLVNNISMGIVGVAAVLGNIVSRRINDYYFEEVRNNPTLTIKQKFTGFFKWLWPFGKSDGDNNANGNANTATDTPRPTTRSSSFLLNDEGPKSPQEKIYTSFTEYKEESFFETFSRTLAGTDSTSNKPTTSLETYCSPSSNPFSTSPETSTPTPSSLPNDIAHQNHPLLHESQSSARRPASAPLVITSSTSSKKTASGNKLSTSTPDHKHNFLKNSRGYASFDEYPDANLLQTFTQKLFGNNSTTSAPVTDSDLKRHPSSTSALPIITTVDSSHSSSGEETKRRHKRQKLSDFFNNNPKPEDANQYLVASHTL